MGSGWLGRSRHLALGLDPQNRPKITSISRCSGRGLTPVLGTNFLLLHFLSPTLNKWEPPWVFY